MRNGLIVRFSAPSLLLLCLLVVPVHVAAQTGAQAPEPGPAARRIGVQGFGLLGVNWPDATETLEATGIDTTQMELGGGLTVARVWRSLFAQVTASQLSGDGERVFVDDDGTAFPLGIPLTLKATFVDVTAGWQFEDSDVGGGAIPYVGAGVGAVNYSERSPLALPGDDFETSATSYHVMAGVLVPVLRWFGVTGEFRYRWVPGVLGDAGVSQAFGENDFGGAQVSFGVWIGTPVPRTRRPPPPAPPAPAPSAFPYATPGRAADPVRGAILSSAPVYLLPDPTRQPLRTLEAGTSVRILEETEGWIRIEFADPTLGPRIGYVERKYVRPPKLP